VFYDNVDEIPLQDHLDIQKDIYKALGSRERVIFSAEIEQVGGFLGLNFLSKKKRLAITSD